MTGLYPPDQINEQCERICHSSALTTANQRKLLRHLVMLHLTGAPDNAYSVKSLGHDVFGSDSSMGQVMTKQVRDALDLYSKSIGVNDPILFAVASRPVRLLITGNQYPLPQRIEHYLASARAAVDMRTFSSSEQAFAYVNRALADHPDHPRILAAKALLHTDRAADGGHPRTELQKAEVLLAQIRARGAEPWEACLADANVRASLHWDWSGARTRYERAIVLSGGMAKYLGGWYGVFLTSQGEAEKAVLQAQEGLQLAHGSAAYRVDLALWQLCAGQIEDAAHTVDLAIADYGKVHHQPHALRALILEHKGDPRGAIEALKKVPAGWHETSSLAGVRALFEGLAGNRAKAKRYLSALKKARSVAKRIPKLGMYVPSTQLGFAALGAGDRDQAVELISEGAVQERDPYTLILNMLPAFRHLHDHPGFRRLIEETMKLPLPAIHAPLTKD